MYDGTQFHGSQVQGEQATVQLAVNNVLKTLFRKEMDTFGASRTDEGVHAMSNFYHFDIDAPIDFDLFYKSNAILNEHISIKAIYEVPGEFNARFDAVSRKYRYKIHFTKNPFLVNRAYYFPFKSNLELLKETASIIPQYKHFETFAKRNMQVKTFLCDILDSHWEMNGEELHYIVKGNRFLRGMVRGLVGTQLMVARGKYDVAGFRKIIESNDCKNAYFDVPGSGLYLEEVNYPEGILKKIEFTNNRIKPLF